MLKTRGLATANRSRQHLFSPCKSFPRI